MNAATQTPAPATKTRAPRGGKKADAGKAPKVRAKKAETGAPKKAPRAVRVPKEAKTPVPLSGKSTDALRLKAPEYVHDKEHKTAGGHVSVHNGDAIAVKLLGKDLDTVYAAAAKALKEDEADLRAKYAHLNPGMQRMNLGNRMRAAAK